MQVAPRCEQAADDGVPERAGAAGDDDMLARKNPSAQPRPRFTRVGST